MPVSEGGERGELEDWGIGSGEWEVQGGGRNGKGSEYPISNKEYPMTKEI